MELKQIKEQIKIFKSTKDEIIFEHLTSSLNLQKCIVTSKNIIYPNTLIRLSKDNLIKISGTCSFTKKIINGKEYSLKVSYEGMVSKFGEDYTNLNTSRIFNRLNKFTKFAFQVEDLDYELEKSTSFGAGVSLDVMIKRYGKKEGTNRFNEYRKKQAYTNSFEYKKKIHGWDEKRFDDFNKSRGITLENQIQKYGVREGTLRFEKYCDRQSETSTYEYLLDKFGKDKADKISDAKARNISHFITIYGESKATEMYIEHKKNIKTTSAFYSKISIDLFDMLISDLNLYEYNIKYKENEYGIYCKNTSKYFKYDFTIPELNLIIEFNGDNWHANPKLYNANDTPNPMQKNLTAKEIWEYDNIKKIAAEIHGFNVLYIWEHDYRNNFQKTYIRIKEIINELRDRRN